MLTSPEFTSSQPSLFFTPSRLSNWVWSPYKLSLGLDVSFCWYECNATLSLLFSFFLNCLHLIVAPLLCLLLFHSSYNCLHLIVPSFLQFSAAHYSLSFFTPYFVCTIPKPVPGTTIYPAYFRRMLVSENTSWGHQPLGSAVRELLLKLTFLFGTERV